VENMLGGEWVGGRRVVVWKEEFWGRDGVGVAGRGLCLGCWGGGEEELGVEDVDVDLDGGEEVDFGAGDAEVDFGAGEEEVDFGWGGGFGGLVSVDGFGGRLG
jgi:hypothetical protein